MPVKTIKLPAPKRGAATPRQPGEKASRHCTGCERDLTVCSFSVKRRSPFRRHSRCRECQSRASRRHYEKNRSAVIARSRVSSAQAVARNRSWLASYLADKTCSDCGLHAPDIYEFDHRRGVKDRTVSQMIHQGLSLQTIQSEIAKCDILCPNCHRLRTHLDQMSYLQRFVQGLLVSHVDIAGWTSPSGSAHEHNMRSNMRRRYRNQMDNIAYLQTHPCVDCSEDDIRLLEYDHVRGEKAAEMWELIQHASSLERIRAERVKCDVRCVNCHRRKSGNVRPLAAAA
jgi:hypothetical protein